MSQLASLEDLKDLSGYKKDLKKSLDKVQASPAKMFYAQMFEFKGRKGPMVLVGEIPSGLSKGLKEARVSLKPGKLRRNDHKELEVFRGLPPEKIAQALKFAGIDEAIADKEVEGEPELEGSQDETEQSADMQQPVLTGAMQKKMEFETTQFEKRKYGEREKTLLAELQNEASSRKDDPEFALLVKEAKADMIRARDAVAKNDFDAANQILDQTESKIHPPALSGRMEKKIAFETGQFEKRADTEFKVREKEVLTKVQQFASDNKDNPDALKGVREIKEQILNARGLAAGKEFDKANAILNRIEVAVSVTGAPQRPQPPLQKPQAPARNEKQEVLKAKASAEFEYVRGASVRFRQGRSKELKKISGGKEFKDFVTRLEKFESTMNTPDRDALEKACNLYLAHYEKDLSEKKQQDSAPKKQQVEQTLKNIGLLKLADEAANIDLGNPPWPKDKEEKARELHAKILVADGRVARLGENEKGNSDSFFLKDTNGKPSYIFKPQNGESRPFLKDHGVPTDELDPNWPEGGGAPREKVFSDFNQTMKESGLDFGIASAVVMELESDGFANGKISQDRKRVGVVQEAIPNDGNAKNFILEGPASGLSVEIIDGKVTRESVEARKKSINTEDVQKIALLDFITLNGDRNADNILLQGKSDQPGTTRLRPIDAGNALPSRKAFEANAMAMHALPSQKGKGISEGNALMQLPQSLEPFSPEMMKQVEGMDPKRVADSLRKSNASLKGDMSGKIEEETFQMVERSVEFLKLACKASPPPSVNELGDIYATEFAKVLDAKPGELPALVTRLVREAQQRSAKVLSDLRAAEQEEEQTEKDFKALGGMAELKRLGGDDQLSLKANLAGLRRLQAAEQEYITLGGDAEYKKLGGQMVMGQKSKNAGNLRDDLKRLKGDK